MIPQQHHSALPVSGQWLMAWDTRLLLPMALALSLVSATTSQLASAATLVVAALVIAVAAWPQWLRLFLLLLPANALLGGVLGLSLLLQAHPHLHGLAQQDPLLWWLRGNAAVLFVLILLASRSLNELIDAALWWRCPRSLVQMTQLMSGFLLIIWDEWQQILAQARLRGWRLRANARSVHGLGWMLGALLLRSDQRAQRVHQAMTLRGGPAPLRRQHWPRLCRWQLASSITLIMLAIALPIVGVSF